MTIFLREDCIWVKVEDDKVIVEAPNGTELLSAAIEDTEATIASLSDNPEFARVV